MPSIQEPTPAQYQQYTTQPIAQLIQLGYCLYPLSGIPHSQHWAFEDFEMRYSEDPDFQSWVEQL